MKDEPVRSDVINQIEYYVNWASQNSGKHLQDAYSWNIQPVIVAPPLIQRNRKDIFDEFRRYNQTKISPQILYFEFKVDCEAKNIIFDQIDY
jgi:hypothetical protein